MSRKSYLLSKRNRTRNDSRTRDSRRNIAGESDQNIGNHEELEIRSQKRKTKFNAEDSQLCIGETYRGKRKQRRVGLHNYRTQAETPVPGLTRAKSPIAVPREGGGGGRGRKALIYLFSRGWRQRGEWEAVMGGVEASALGIYHYWLIFLCYILQLIGSE